MQRLAFSAAALANGQREFGAYPKGEGETHALATAMETPRMALAPSSVLFWVPSSLFRKASTADWSLTSSFSLIRAGAILSLTLATALVTPVAALSARHRPSGGPVLP